MGLCLGGRCGLCHWGCNAVWEGRKGERVEARGGMPPAETATCVQLISAGGLPKSDMFSPPDCFAVACVRQPDGRRGAERSWRYQLDCHCPVWNKLRALPGPLVPGGSIEIKLYDRDACCNELIGTATAFYDDLRGGGEVTATAGTEGATVSVRVLTAAALESVPRRKTVFFVRHGESTWNCGGVRERLADRDHGLSLQGRLQAEALCRRVSDLVREAGTADAAALRRLRDVAVSPLTRAIETALIGLQGLCGVSAGAVLLADLREHKTALGRDTAGHAAGDDIRARVSADLSRVYGDPAELAADVFRRMDSNGDGRLSRKEVRQFLRKNPAVAERLGVGAAGTWDSFLAAWDADGDGEVNEDEFATKWVRAAGLNRVAPAEAAEADKRALAEAQYLASRVDVNDARGTWWTRYEDLQSVDDRAREVMAWVKFQPADSVCLVGHSLFFRRFARACTSAATRKDCELLRRLTEEKLKNAAMVALDVDFGNDLSSCVVGARMVHSGLEGDRSAQLLPSFHALAAKVQRGDDESSGCSPPPGPPPPAKPEQPHPPPPARPPPALIRSSSVTAAGPQLGPGKRPSFSSSEAAREARPPPRAPHFADFVPALQRPLLGCPAGASRHVL
eukprot:TRINITY_DN8112_c0_g1_i1.p1 TRINITY_DN8112_c0_g1~~TRINITY_DN8112_c0_g1_i1.p1  ORF type:complete len:623 (+),score=225.44 TRINITY_DN8112_c0_g1_i1:56-1924(+)